MSTQEALVTPSVMQWARERARLSPEDAAARIGRPVEEIEAWEKGEKRPSMAQARKASEAYKRSLAVFYLPEPPQDFDTLKDFRQLPETAAREYSPELALIIRQLQSRQEWMREYLIRQGASPVAFVGSASVTDSPVELAKSIRSTLGVTTGEQCSCPTPIAALNYWVNKAEAIGACVCREGKVAIEEARGIALTDEYAPFIYVNAKDSYSGRQFTLLHELVHLWINESGLSDLAIMQKTPRSPDAATEVFCNRTAALVLIPPADFRSAWAQRDEEQELDEQIAVVAKSFKVSDETVARRLLDGNVITQAEYGRLRGMYGERWREHRDQRQGGGSYYRNEISFNGRLFTRTVLSARYSGQITVREACLTLGVKANHLKELAETAGLFSTRQGGSDQ
jgi:Zn-dependent peptidase ImmA (M78 family)